jgi:hypothetical protein
MKPRALAHLSFPVFAGPETKSGIDNCYAGGQFELKKAAKSVWVGCVLALLAGQLSSTNLQAESSRTQTIQLHRGWNAVFLEVYPFVADPAIVFSNAPVDIVASYYPHNGSAQFMATPSADLFKKSGWGVWYAGKRPDAFLKTLFAIYGQQPYLIQAKSDYTLTITGSVVPPDVHWQPNAYNLVGFSVSSPGAPTFARFFAGSTAHQHNRLYRLTDGNWRRVLDPGAETMRSGEAFWIYSEGTSKYQGPLSVETTIAQGVFLGSGSDALTLRNQSADPITATIQHVPAGTNSLPLSIVIRALSDGGTPIQSVAAAQPNGPWTHVLPPLEAGAAMQVPFEVRQQELNSTLQGSLLQISTDLGTEVWLPVVGVRKDLEAQ